MLPSKLYFFRNYLLCSHPHGVLSAGAFCCFATEGTNFSGVTSLIIPMLQFGLCPSQCLNIFLLFVNEDLFQGFPGYLTSPASVGANVLDSLLQRPLVHNWVSRCHKGLANDSIYIQLPLIYIFREAWRAYWWRNQAARLQFWFQEELLRRSTATRGRWGGWVCSRSGQGVRWGWSSRRRRALSNLRWSVASRWCPPSPLGKQASMTRWPRVKGRIITMTVLSAWKQGGLLSKEHPGLLNLDSRVCSGHLPGSRHFPI